VTLAFAYDALPGRVRFGAGALADLPAELDALDVRRAIVLTTPEQGGQGDALAERIGARAAGRYAKAAMHVPIEVVEEALSVARRCDADCLLAIGGGSTTGLAKALSLRIKLPIVAVPTTFAGSEMTPIWGVTEGAVKTTGRDLRVLPRLVIYDPDLLATLPPDIVATSGMNAIAHCVEALYAQNANPITSLMAEEGVRAIARALPRAARPEINAEARAEVLYGAWLGGSVLGAVGMALHHKLCHTLGGSFNLPHAEVHTILIPHVTAYNALAASEAVGRVAGALGVATPGEAGGALFDLVVATGARTRLSDIGMTEADLDRAAELATRNPYYNPRPIDRTSIRKLLDDAFLGRRPMKIAA
jgi:maleylacetate reductase